MRSMANLSILCMIMTFITLLIISASKSTLALTKSSMISPSSPPSVNKQGQEQAYQINGGYAVEDYGFWDPSPFPGGGNYSPIPHGEV